MQKWVNGLWQRYLVAAFAVGAGIGVKYALSALSPQVESPFLLMAVSVIVAGWYGGAGPGILATVLTTLGVRWLFMDPKYSLTLTASGDAMNLLVFVVEGAFIALMCESRLRAVQESNRAREELEGRVVARTADLSRANASLEEQVEERRRAEQEIYRQREYLKALLTSLEEGIVALDENGKVVLVNRAALAMYSLPAETTPYEEWGKYHQTFYGDGVTPMAQDERPLARVWREELLVDMEKVVVGKDGRRRDLLSSGSTIIGENGERIGAVVAFRDVTERRKHEEELKRYTAQLQRSNRELQDFASVASHDLQEPLRKIRAFGDRLKVKYIEAMGEEGGDYLGRMLNAAERMSALINDLLTFSRVTTRAQPFARVELKQIAEDVMSDLETRIEETGGRVEIGALPAVEADAMQIRQLMQNLIGNALKFHKPGKGTMVEISGKVEHEAEMGRVCRLRVKDDGIGFDEKYLDRIFNVFQRLHGRNEYEGTGIGLAVCRKIAERHHGSITARSVPGEGSTFIVTLPLQQTERPFDEATINDGTGNT
ncbi:MAG TPA: ATP-binding protein [Tepidisphaeraceae bacterium]|jgi:signal transduction histidine kinase|nr:ATP-binding protein [Tepidisphaeraceae bacterium]